MLNNNYFLPITFSYQVKSLFEENACLELCKLIIHYPLVWYHYTNEILNKGYVIKSENNSLIISYNQAPNISRQTIDKILTFLHRFNFVKQKIIQKDITIVYLQYHELCKALTSNEVWLRYLTYFTIKKIIPKKVYLEPQLNFPNIKYQLDLLFIKNRTNYAFLCNIKKNIVWKPLAKNNIFLICITLDDIRLPIPVITYKYNYEQFKNDLIDLFCHLRILEMFYF